LNLHASTSISRDLTSSACRYGRRCCFIHTQRDLIKKQDDLEKNLIVLRKPERRRDDDWDIEGEPWGQMGSYFGYDDRWVTLWDTPHLLRTELNKMTYSLRSRTSSYDYGRPGGITNKPPRLQTLEAADQAAADLGMDPFGPIDRIPSFTPLGAIGSEKAGGSNEFLGPIGSGREQAQYDRDTYASYPEWALPASTSPTRETLSTPLVSPILSVSKDNQRYPPSPEESYDILNPKVSQVRGGMQATDASPYANLLASVSPALNGSRGSGSAARLPADPTFGAFAGPFGTAWDGHTSGASTETLLFEGKGTFSSEENKQDREPGAELRRYLADREGQQREAEQEDDEGADYDRTFVEESDDHGHKREESVQFIGGWDGADFKPETTRVDVQSNNKKEGEDSSKRQLGDKAGSGWDSYTY
jgi:hypothetical protein